MFRKQRIRKLVLLAIPLFASVAFAADSAIDRWANAAGGRERISKIKSIYREGTIEYAGKTVDSDSENLETAKVATVGV